MIAGYNPVYSYLYAKDGHYTLIKPFTPYTGLVGSGINYDYYYDVGHLYYAAVLLGAFAFG